MQKMVQKILSCVFLYAFICAFKFVVSESDLPVVIIVSFDGFRYDYLNKTETPNFDSLIKGGVWSPNGIEARFVTKTFPNHHSIATGVYEEVHGIIANSFYDPILNDTFDVTKHDSKWWDTGVLPLWISNQLEGDGRWSGGAMWPGTEATFKNQTPVHLLPYNSSMDWHERVDNVVTWLTNKTHPANCVFMYFEYVDSAGHEFGPDSPQVEAAIQKADNITGYLITKLQVNNLFDNVNIIITSDHGMTSTPAENHYDINNFLSKNTYKVFGTSPVLNIWPNNDQTEEVYQILSNASKSKHFKVYKKNEIPDEYHYKNNVRISPIILEADEHWSISNYKTNDNLGNHGYNSSLQSMRPFFIAHGPAFVKEQSVKGFRNIDIYPLAAYILGIQPQLNNGSLDNVVQLLRHPPQENIDQVVLIVVAVLLTICVIAAVLFIIKILRKYKREKTIGQEGVPDEHRSLIQPTNIDDS